MVYLILAFALHSNPAQAIRLHDAHGFYQEEPPGCHNKPRMTGLFDCDVGQIQVYRGRVNLGGKDLCAFAESTGVPGLLFLEVDNLSDELTYQFKCTRSPARSGVNWF